MEDLSISIKREKEDDKSDNMNYLIKKCIDEKKEDQEVFSIIWKDCTYSVYIQSDDQDNLHKKLSKLFAKYA